MTPSVEVRFEPALPGVSGAWVKKVVSGALKAEKAHGRSVSVWITDDRRIRGINKKHLKHDYATDVISFGSGEKTGFLGDLVASAPTARRVAKELDIPFKEELARYLVHGTLHLLGYDDQKPKDFSEMHARQEGILKCL